VHQFVVYLIDPATAAFYTYLNSTIGACIAYENLRERVITMRALRGARVVPLVRLTQRPMKTKFGPKHRPEFEPVEWRCLGGDDNVPVGITPTPQLLGPQGTSADPEAEAKPKLEPKAATKAPAAGAADATIATMGKVTPPTVSEEIDDEIPWR
jgi:hypothetical protein